MCVRIAFVALKFARDSSHRATVKIPYLFRQEIETSRRSLSTLLEGDELASLFFRTRNFTNRIAAYLHAANSIRAFPSSPAIERIIDVPWRVPFLAFKRVGMQRTEIPRQSNTRRPSSHSLIADHPDEHRVDSLPMARAFEPARSGCPIRCRRPIGRLP